MPFSPIGPREESLFHLKWLLGCLEPGVMVEIDERRFRRVFGFPSTRVFQAAAAFARNMKCRFVYDVTKQTAMFQRVGASGSTLGKWLHGGPR